MRSARSIYSSTMLPLSSAIPPGISTPKPSRRTHTTLELARAAGVALEQITQSIHQINERNLVIASASQEQAQVSLVRWIAIW